MAVAGDTLFVLGATEEQSATLWTVDVATNEVHPVRSIWSNRERAFRSFEDVGGALFFVVATDTVGNAIWRTDGTEAGTRLIVRMVSETSGSFPVILDVIDEVALFRADDGSQGRELWRSDGTENGTYLVKDIWPGSNSGISSSQSAQIDGTLYFIARDEESGSELWRSDGTEAGTTIVRDIYPHRGSSNPLDLLAIGNTLYFLATDVEHGQELWKTDGTDRGTTLVKDINVGPNGSFRGTLGIKPAQLTNVNGTLYFEASDGATGWQLWKSDGTLDGTVPVSQFDPSSHGITWMTAANDRIFFTQWDGNDQVLWTSDGTLLGTRPVQSTHGLIRGPSEMQAIGNNLFFAYQNQLWKSDGTSDGTGMVKEIVVKRRISAGPSFIEVNGVWYFGASEPSTGTELWRTDGTPEGTFLVSDMVPGPRSSNPEKLKNMHGVLYFVALSSGARREIWSTDGTSSGTAPAVGFDADELFELNEHVVIFAAAAEGHGKELIVFRPDQDVGPRPFPWQNPRDTFDANDDGSTTSLDALVIINHLNRGDGAELPIPPANSAHFFVDVSGDNFVTPIDVLLVINELNARAAAASVGFESAPKLSASEGEATWPPAFSNADTSSDDHADDDHHTARATVVSRPQSFMDVPPLSPSLHTRDADNVYSTIGFSESEDEMDFFDGLRPTCRDAFDQLLAT